MHFKHISVKIQPKNLKLVHLVRGYISIGGPAPWATSWLRPWCTDV